MSNVRTVKTSNYVQLHNKAGLDKTLTAKAKGILFTAMALPPEYEINKSTFHTFFKDGRDSIKGGIEELVKAGYGFHEQINNGKFEAVTLISDIKFTMLAELSEEALEHFVTEINDDLLYALKRIRETGLTYIGKEHDEARKKKAKKTKRDNNTTVTENPLRNISHEESVTKSQLEINKDFENGISITTITTTEAAEAADILNKEEALKHALEFAQANIKHLSAWEKIETQIKRYLRANTKEKIQNYVYRILDDHDKETTKQPEQPKQSRSTRRGRGKAIRTEIVPDWLQPAEAQPQQQATKPGSESSIDEERKRLEKELEMFKNKKKEKQWA